VGWPIQADDAYLGESLNTGDITVHLKEGYNYLGNPYTCPLDLSGLKTEVPEVSKATDPWGVSRHASDEDIDLYAGFWIMHSGAKTGTPDSVNHKFSISVSYDVAQSVGGTVKTDSIPPMQLFAVYAYRDCDLTIPDSGLRPYPQQSQFPEKRQRRYR
jgi:hypothetical protein